jgi:hypothetical protein
MATARKNRPTEGAVHEVPAKGPTRMIQAPDDIGAQLGRLETLLDRVIRSLDVLAGAL